MPCRPAYSAFAQRPGPAQPALCKLIGVSPACTSTSSVAAQRHCLGCPTLHPAPSFPLTTTTTAPTRPPPTAELGLSAVLAAKRALLHAQSCPGAPLRQEHQKRDGGMAAPPTAPARAAQVLPLLELSVGSCPAVTQAASFQLLAGPHLRAAQQRWEAAQGGGMQLWLPPAGGGSGGGGHTRRFQLSLLEDPPGACCSFCPGEAAALADCPRGWPPESTAELLATLGRAGLAQLQALDLAGITCCDDAADVIAASCRQGQRIAAIRASLRAPLGWLAGGERRPHPAAHPHPTPTLLPHPTTTLPLHRHFHRPATHTRT